MPPSRSSAGVRAPRRHKPSPLEGGSKLDLVREGVRRFILNKASLDDFYRIFRLAGITGRSSSHPLTGIAFRRIVKEAISEQRRQTDMSRRRRKGSNTNDE